MLAFVASGVLGLVRQAAIGAAFGADVELTPFVAAQRVLRRCSCWSRAGARVCVHPGAGELSGEV